MRYITPHALQAIAWYPFNVAHADIVEQVYGADHHDGYIQEKLRLLRERGLLWFFCQLDGSHRAVLCELIENKYKDYLMEAAGE